MKAIPAQNAVLSLFRRELYGRISNQYYGNPAYIPASFQQVACSSEDNHAVHGSHLEANGVPPFACSFGKTPDALHVLAIADEDGHVALYDTRNGCKHVKEWPAHHNAIFDLTWSDTEPWVVTAAGDQTAALWDVSRGCRLAVFKQHSSSLKSVSFRQGDKHVFATGARDGKIMIWDIRCNHKEGPPSFHTPVSIISDTHVPTSSTTLRPAKRQRLASAAKSSVTAVVFSDEHSVVSAGDTEGTIKVWDIRTIYKGRAIPKHEYPYCGISTRKKGFSSLVLNSSRSRVYANCTDHVIYAFDLLGLNNSPVACYTGHENTTFYVKSALSVDDKFLLSGSSDHNAYIWKVDEPRSAPLQVTGHTEEVTAVTWSRQDFPKFVTCADDNSFRVWRQHNLSPKEMTESEGIMGRVTQQKPTTVHRQNMLPLSPCQSPRPPSIGCSSPVTPMQPKVKPSLKKNSSIKTFFAKKRPAPASPDVCDETNHINSARSLPKIQRLQEKENTKTRDDEAKVRTCVQNGDDSESGVSHSEQVHHHHKTQLDGIVPISSSLSCSNKDQTEQLCQNLQVSPPPRVPLSPRKGCSNDGVKLKVEKSKDNEHTDIKTKEFTHENGKENQRGGTDGDNGASKDRQGMEEGKSRASSATRRMLSWPNSADGCSKSFVSPCQGCKVITSPAVKQKPSSKITGYFKRLSKGRADQSS